MDNYINDVVVSLEDLCKTYWTTKTPGAIRVDICRGENYPFLFKLGKQWVARVGDFKLWLEKQKSKQQTRK